MRHFSWAPEGDSLAFATLDASVNVLEVSGGQKAKLQKAIINLLNDWLNIVPV